MKKILTGAAGAVALVSSINIQSQMLTTDAATLAEVVAGNQERALQHYATQAWEKAKLQFQGESSAAQVDAVNSGFSNMTIRTTQAMTDLFNMERLKESLPAISACETTTLNVLGRDSMCAEQEAANLTGEKFTAKNATFGMTLEEQREVTKYHHREHFDACLELSNGDPARNRCADSSVIYSGDTLSPEDAEVARRNVDLMVGVAPRVRSRPDNIDQMTPEEITNYNNELRSLSYQALAHAAKNYVISQRESPDASNNLPSPLHRLKAESEARWGSEDWITSITNTPPNANPEQLNQVMETQLLREMAVMDAFKVHLEVIKYEQMLRDYDLQASMLALLAERL